MDTFVDSLRRAIDGPPSASRSALLKYIETCTAALAEFLDSLEAEKLAAAQKQNRDEVQ